MCCVVLCCVPADIKALQPSEDEVKELRNHVIIAGYGRVGQIIAQMLSELLIPFVALDVRSDRWGLEVQQHRDAAIECLRCVDP